MLAPQSNVFGVDIDGRMIEIASSKYRDFKNTAFALSSWDTIKSNGPYDIIMANAVLGRYPDSGELDDLAPVFPFQQFEDMLGRLVGSLAPNGVLMVQNANYSVEDTDLGLSPVATPTAPFNSFIPKFDRSGRRIVDAAPGFLISYLEDAKVDPFAVLRHSVFSADQSLPGVFAPPAYVEQPGALIETVERREKRGGWRAAPYDCLTVAVLVNDERRILKRYQAGARVLGETIDFT
jgi:hypothetical protein